MPIKMKIVNQSACNNSKQDDVQEPVASEYVVSIEDVFCPRFLLSCSRFSSLKQFFDASGFKIACLADFENIPIDQWNTFIANNTTFANWFDMQQAASDYWLKHNVW